MTQATNKKPRTPRTEMVKTHALRRYYENNNYTQAEIGAMVGVDRTKIMSWMARGSVPRSALQKLNIRARKARGESDVQAAPKGGSFYACYVGADDKEVFEVFCKALGISAKYVI